MILDLDQTHFQAKRIIRLSRLQFHEKELLYADYKGKLERMLHQAQLLSAYKFLG